jgi:hypothetical protein
VGELVFWRRTNYSHLKHTLVLSLCVGMAMVDWTIGCVAVTDSQIEELYRVVPDGTPIEFRP